MVILLGCAEPTASDAVRISLDVRGVRPTVDELAAWAADPDEALDAWLQDARFEARVRDLYNEVWQTRVDEFPVTAESAGAEDAAAFARSIGEEPLRLLGHVAANDLPWTTLVTADFTMADEQLAAIWPLTYTGPGWARATYNDGRPAGGLLVSNGLWWRYGSTSSNGNRKRANQVSKALLCNDYLVRPIEFDRSVDLLDEDAVADAVRTQPGCVSCHVALDPFASFFFGFQWLNWKSLEEARRYWPDREQDWREVTGVAPSWYGRPAYSLAELGPLVANDPRFASCAVEQAFSLLVRRAPTAEDDLEAPRRAFAPTLTLRPLVRAIVESDAYRSAPPRLATPDLLASQMEDLTGFAWTEGSSDLLRSDVEGYRTLAGGADGYTVQRTATLPGATVLLVQERLAEVAARHAVDTLPATLFPGPLVDPAEDEAAARALLQHLHLRLFAEDVAADAPAVEEELALWQALHEGDVSTTWALVLSALLRDPRMLAY